MTDHVKYSATKSFRHTKYYSTWAWPAGNHSNSKAFTDRLVKQEARQHLRCRRDNLRTWWDRLNTRSKVDSCWSSCALSRINIGAVDCRRDKTILVYPANLRATRSAHLYCRTWPSERSLILVRALAASLVPLVGTHRQKERMCEGEIRT